ncbi:hypothetical protein T06_1426 [Trichinella sp. T6]|nr:hypothetical protein T06_1426 [Trichinella sp. T6]
MRIEALVMLLRSLAASVRFICAFGFVLCLHSKLTPNILGFRLRLIGQTVCFEFETGRDIEEKRRLPVCELFVLFKFQTQQLPVEDVRHTSCRRFVVLKRRQNNGTAAVSPQSFHYRGGAFPGSANKTIQHVPFLSFPKRYSSWRALL